MGIGFRQRQWLDQRLHQLECDPGAAQHFEAGGVVGALRIHDRVGGRKLRPRQVMIGDDHLDSRGARTRHRVDRGDAAITCHNKCGTNPLRFGKAGTAEVVPVSHAMRQERVHVGAGGAKRTGQYGGGTLSIDIVVAMDKDALPGGHGRRDDGDGIAHPGQDEWIGERVKRRSQEGFRSVGIAEAPLDQQGGKRQRERERVSQRARSMSIRRRRDPPPRISSQATTSAT